MTPRTTEQLQTIQAKAGSILDAIIESPEGNTNLQSGTSCRRVVMNGQRFSEWLMRNRLWRISCCSRLNFQALATLSGRPGHAHEHCPDDRFKTSRQ